jgi:hypothetical protein
MIHLSLEIRSGGNVVKTINFNSGGYKLLDGFYPQSESSDEKVTESFDIMIKEDGYTDLETKVRDIEQAFDFARSHLSGPDGVWILFSAKDTTLAAWQSRISGGLLTHNPYFNKYWKEYKVWAHVIVERNNYWETVDPVTLQVTNRAGTGASAAIENHQDSGTGHDIYLEIAADQVTGVLPTPAIIEFTPTSNDAALVDTLTVGHFAACGTNEPPTAASLINEGTGTSDASCSGGSYAALSWTLSDPGLLASWTLASAAFRQKNYKAIAKLRDAVAYTDLWLQARLYMGTKQITETRWTLVPAGEQLISIGSLAIPPFRLGKDIDLGNLTLSLYSKMASGAGSLNLDYLATIPQDSWRRFGAISGLAYNETLIDDPVGETLVTKYSTSSYKVTHTVEEGGPVMLQPGVKNVLYFLVTLTDKSAPTIRAANVTIKIHPRRLTV